MFLYNASLKTFQGTDSLTDNIRYDFYLSEVVVFSYLDPASVKRLPHSLI